MSEEEKKSIDRLIIYKDKIRDELYPIIDFEEEKAIGVVLNLIEKQQKEIEELKEKNKQIEYIKRNFDYCIAREKEKWEDKIKAKIEEYDDEINQLRIDRNVTFDSLIYRNSIKKDALQELLEDK